MRLSFVCVSAFVCLAAYASLAKPVKGLLNPKPQPYDTPERFVDIERLPIAGAEGNAVTYAMGYKLRPIGTDLFIGLSDLKATQGPDGLTVEAVSDAGSFATFTIPANHERRGPLTFELLRGTDGQVLGNKVLADAEALAVDERTGDYYIAFEGEPRVLRYRAEGSKAHSEKCEAVFGKKCALEFKGAAERVPLQNLPSLPDNEGLEAMTLLRDKQGDASLLLGAESGGFWLCPLSTFNCATIRGPKTPGFGYALVSLSALPDRPDDILALYRFYTPWTGPRTKLTHLRLEGGRLVSKGELLTIAPPMPYANYEGVSAIQTDGGYRLYLISDPIEEDEEYTLLLGFDWAFKE
ncbi:esterase-like activity of phytase family protein [Asticcacaulis sp. SL142]|uniref:esterase-like activity of phytase family protein n=1 Tax=Asticcacaulis sp. SL142 TaxID=2995155 RepID=UPI00226C9E8E|nr:esterase-like activity of phytase family protein [Asticcacaulis sp. SL142]WAC49335.1 esterase-like activity of phytase family protein [Asticcacaulis sp. SL142]